MIIEPEPGRELKLQLLTHCPTLYQQVWRHEFKQFAIPGGQVIWWHCEVCQGWHAVVMSDDSKSAQIAVGMQ